MELYTHIKSYLRPLTTLVFLLAITVNCVVLPLLTVLSSANANDSHSHLSDAFWIAAAAYLSTYSFGRTKEKLSNKD